MIHIYRASYAGEIDDCEINVFHGRDYVTAKEVKLVKREIYGKPYVHAEPAAPGCYAFGGSFLYTSNGVFKDFSAAPVPLHDRDMSKER